MTEPLESTWPWPEVMQPHPEPQTAWVQYDDGCLGAISVTGSEVPELARPGRFISQAEYEELATEMSGAHAARLEALDAIEAERQAAEYAELRAAGIPESTARRLSGFTGKA
ncbi:hypothetical protein ABZ682_23235 [Streptomyces griseoviridis]|uniref:hypothetical protein n=1 Tax=Streptomyces griseoviridis TaxID=45398 RepID=UPI0033F1D15E